MIFAVMTAFGVFGLLSKPALADCAGKMESVQKQVDAPRANAKNNSWTGVEKLLAKAKKAQASGNNKRCEKLLKKAQGKIDNSG